MGLARLDVGLVTWLAAATITTISDDTAIGPVHVTTHMHVRNGSVGIARVEGGWCCTSSTRSVLPSSTPLGVAHLLLLTCPTHSAPHPAPHILLLAYLRISLQRVGAQVRSETEGWERHLLLYPSVLVASTIHN